MSVRLEPATNYSREVARLFQSSMCLGDPLPFSLKRIKQYEDLCIGWYLRSDAKYSVVAVVDDQVVGYVLICDELKSLDRWVTTRSLRLILIVCLMRAARLVDAQSWAFYRNRVRDARNAWSFRRTQTIWPNISVHMNIERQFRTGEVSLALRNHIDEVCRVTGNDFWIGEVNAVGEKRARALSRVVGEVLSIRKNITMAEATAQDVRLVTVMRKVNYDVPKEDALVS